MTEIQNGCLRHQCQFDGCDHKATTERFLKNHIISEHGRDRIPDAFTKAKSWVTE